MTRVKPILVGVDTKVVNAVEVESNPNKVVCAQIVSGHFVCLVSKSLGGEKAWQEVYDAEIKAENPATLKELGKRLSKQTDVQLVDALNKNPNVVAALSKWATQVNRMALMDIDPEKYNKLLGEKNQIMEKVLRGFDGAVAEALLEIAQKNVAPRKPRQAKTSRKSSGLGDIG